MKRNTIVGILVMILLMSMPLASGANKNAPKSVFVQIDGPITQEVLSTLRANGMKIT